MKFDPLAFAVPKEVFLSYVSYENVERFAPVAKQLPIPEDIQKFIDKNNPKIWEKWHNDAIKQIPKLPKEDIQKWVDNLGSPFRFLRAELRGYLKSLD